MTITVITIDHGREDERVDESQGCSVPDSELLLYHIWTVELGLKIFEDGFWIALCASIFRFIFHRQGISSLV